MPRAGRESITLGSGVKLIEPSDHCSFPSLSFAHSSLNAIATFISSPAPLSASSTSRSMSRSIKRADQILKSSDALHRALRPIQATRTEGED